MDVNVASLRIVADKLFEHLQQSGNNVVSIPHDYYWSIPKDTLYDPYSEPINLTLGQLSDDLAELNRIQSGNSEPLAYALVWLAAVIRAVGEEIVS